MGECIEHTQVGDVFGYGNTRRGGHSMKMHRAVFFDVHGYLPEVVRHTCDNPRCINPEHLLAGTQKDNMRDCVERGRRTPPPRHNKLSQEQVLEIRRGNTSAKDLAERFGVSKVTIYNVRNLKRGYYHG